MCFVHSCTNGFTTLISPRPGTGVASLRVWVETGSMLEGELVRSGVSHLVEHMVFKGTEEYPTATLLSEEVASLGGMWNAYTSTGRTVYYIDGPAERWERFLHILAQLTLHPSFPDDEWEREREVIRQEMAMGRDDPDEAAYLALMETLFTKHPRRYPVIGEPAFFDALRPEDMRRYHAERYVPGNMFACIVGDVKLEAAVAAVEREFGSAPARCAPPIMLPEEPRQWGPRLCRREFPQSTSSLMLAWRVPTVHHPDMAPLTLLCSILGDGRSAWLYRRYHDESGMAHDISASLIAHSGSGEGALVIEADVERDKRDALRESLLAYVAQLADADASPMLSTALQRQLRQMHVRHMRAMSTVQGAAEALGGFWRHTRNANAYEEWRAALEAVTPEDIRRVARLYLNPQRLVEVSIDPVGSNGNAEEAKKATAAAAPSVATLPGGMRCITQTDRRLPLLHASLAIGAGCRVENAANSGICALLAKCLPKGTTTRSAAQIAEELENLGGELHASYGQNSIMLHLHCLAEHAEQMLELLADIALHPSLDDTAVQTVRADRLAAIRDADEQPMSYAFRHLREACFGQHSYGNSPQGREESVSKLTRDDLVQMHRHLLCSGNMVLSLVGDIEADTLRAKAQQLFDKLPSAPKPTFCATPPQRAADLCLPGPAGKEQAALALALPGLPLSSADYPLLLLLNAWCQDICGPIFTEIREQRGLAYDVGSGLLMGVDAGCLFFELETAPHMLHEARHALESTLDRLAQEGMPPDALERAKATILAARKLALQSPGKICSGMAIDELLGLGAGHAEQLHTAISAVQPEQMQRFLRSALSPEATHTWVSVAPAQA